jgi:beta-galactosidase/beta-glucuronidase
VPPSKTNAKVIATTSGIFLAIIAAVASALDAPESYKPAAGPFGMTRWAKEVSPQNALPEYPRPQMVRNDWLSLNGPWRYAVVGVDAPQPEAFQGKILVPFPIEAPLSGIGKRINTLPGRTYSTSRVWYQRTFQVPQAWNGRRVLLNFGAVNWESTVLLNGKQIGVHQGGYDGFSFDITAALKPDGGNELVVAVFNPCAGGGYPRGKQVDDPQGIWYTPSTGIWQTAWLEPVPETSISGLRLTPDIDSANLRVEVITRGKTDGLKVNAVAFDRELPIAIINHRRVPGEVGAAIAQTPGQPFDVQIVSRKLWSPDSPFLFGLEVALARDGKVVDSVESYFGMRKVSIGPDKVGITRMFLNNKFILHNGVLDQGFWPDGLYTAPTDAALRYDIETIKRLGFNMSRKHVKVEPDRWYYWADKLGLLVWQDMPCTGDGIHAGMPRYAASASRRQDHFAAELRAMIDGRFNHPSIVSWIVFNEGMGLENSGGYKLDDNIRTFMRRMANIAAEDKTRAINAESGAPGGQYQGWNVLDIGTGQIMDAHCYGTTKCIPPTKGRASVIGEYGYAKYLDAIHKYRPLVKKPGVSGLVWTQLTDVENERNGLMSYDRGTFHEDPEKVAAENARYDEDQ